MSEVHKRVLLKTRVRLIEDISPEELCPHLLSNEVITSREKEIIQSGATRSEQVEGIVDIISRKPDSHFELFVECLKESSHKHLAYMLIAGTFLNNDLITYNLIIK